ncbi:MAG: hypothetical protein KGI50_00865 [Patescibacteria group bacterium]|nr:hypothetical protein [Patescibacteria group bacterium]MDE2438095.1 hypothetical protein [Patescibacteria group bacterium]
MPNIPYIIHFGFIELQFFLHAISWIHNAFIHGSPLFFYVKLVSGIVSFLFFIGIVWLVMKTRFLTLRVERFKNLVAAPAYVDKKRVLHGWLKVQERMAKGDEANMRLAIVDADKLIDSVLKQMGYAGDTMAERLKQITPAQLSSIQDLWTAHKIRNNIVHDPEHMISQEQARDVILMYEKVFREMALID